MTAPFVRELCGYREGRPNTSDKNDGQSLLIGKELFARLGIGSETLQPSNVGALTASKIAADLRSVRSDLDIDEDRRASDFAQYAHMTAMHDIRAALQSMQYETAEVELRIRRLLELVAVESLLKVDIAVTRPGNGQQPRLLAAFSCKWTLRTDRAQDCISQGAKLVGHRRGHMPHYAVITMETRPAMLAYLADGSGSVDYIYHLALPELIAAIESIAADVRGNKQWPPLVTLRRLLAQRRLRDYDDLVDEVGMLPHA